MEIECLCLAKRIHLSSPLAGEKFRVWQIQIQERISTGKSLPISWSWHCGEWGGAWRDHYNASGLGRLHDLGLALSGPHTPGMELGEEVHSPSTDIELMLGRFFKWYCNLPSSSSSSSVVSSEVRPHTVQVHTRSQLGRQLVFSVVRGEEIDHRELQQNCTSLYTSSNIQALKPRLQRKAIILEKKLS